MALLTPSKTKPGVGQRIRKSLFGDSPLYNMPAAQLQDLRKTWAAGPREANEWEKDFNQSENFATIADMYESRKPQDQIPGYADERRKISEEFTKKAGQHSRAIDSLQKRSDYLRQYPLPNDPTQPAVGAAQPKPVPVGTNSVRRVRRGLVDTLPASFQRGGVPNASKGKSSPVKPPVPTTPPAKPVEKRRQRYGAFVPKAQDGTKFKPTPPPLTGKSVIKDPPANFRESLAKQKKKNDRKDRIVGQFKALLPGKSKK